MGLIDSNTLPQKVAEELDKLHRNDAIYPDYISDLDSKVKQALSNLKVAKSLKGIINAKQPMILKVLKPTMHWNKLSFCSSTPVPITREFDFQDHDEARLMWIIIVTYLLASHAMLDLLPVYMQMIDLSRSRQMTPLSMLPRLKLCMRCISDANNLQLRTAKDAYA